MARWRGYYDDFYRFPRSAPREAKGGIKAQTKRGTFGESWWAKRWISVLESFNIGARLGRGRSYARSGQVLSIEVDKGLVKASVQGSRPKPYAVKIQVKAIPETGWKKLAAALSRQALFAAKLLAGEMPAEIEKAFQPAGLSLFPEKLRDLETECSCPDWSNPCKHIAAVYYLLGEEFDRDPFLIFKMRGMSREEFLGLLGAEAAGEAPALAAPPEPLDASAAFWGKPELPEGVFGDATQPDAPALLARRLGKFPFWRGKQGLLEAIEPAYSAASSRGLELFVGEK